MVDIVLRPGDTIGYTYVKIDEDKKYDFQILNKTTEFNT